jgi:hypothetical protein
MIITIQCGAVYYIYIMRLLRLQSSLDLSSPRQLGQVTMFQQHQSQVVAVPGRARPGLCHS